MGPEDINRGSSLVSPANFCQAPSRVLRANLGRPGSPGPLSSGCARVPRGVQAKQARRGCGVGALRFFRTCSHSLGDVYQRQERLGHAKAVTRRTSTIDATEFFFMGTPPDALRHRRWEATFKKRLGMPDTGHPSLTLRPDKRVVVDN